MREQLNEGNEVALLWPGEMKLFNKAVGVRNSSDFENIKSFELINSLPISYDEGIENILAFTASCDGAVYRKFLETLKPDKEFGEAVYNLKNFGIHGPERVEAVGANAKMNEFCAAMGLCNLRHVDEEIEKRRKVIERYREHLKNVDGLKLNPINPDVKYSYSYFPVIFEEKEFGASRNEVFDALAAQRIGARKYFYPLTNTFDCFHGMYDVNSRERWHHR